MALHQSTVNECLVDITIWPQLIVKARNRQLLSSLLHFSIAESGKLQMRGLYKVLNGFTSV